MTSSRVARDQMFSTARAVTTTCAGGEGPCDQSHHEYDNATDLVLPLHVSPLGGLDPR